MKKNKEHPHYGLYGEADILLPDFMHGESIEVNSKKHDGVIKPHFHSNLFQIFLIESGWTKFQYEDEQVYFDEPCVITVPENTLHGFEFCPELDGKVLTLSHSFVEILFQNAPNVLLELNQVIILTDIGTPRRFQTIGRILHRLYEELKDDLPEKNFALQCYFSLLLTEIYRLSVEINERKIMLDNRYAKYYKEFQRDIKNAYNPQKTIYEYASDLKITTVHLNRVCRAVVDKSALQTVTDFFVLEAEKYLRHTDFSVSEVAYRLNFEDAAYFSRLFKKHVGVSPKQFRSSANK